MPTVCTATMCRSPLLEVPLGAERRAREADGHVHPGGTPAGGRGAVSEMAELAEKRRLDPRAHAGRGLAVVLVAGAHLARLHEDRTPQGTLPPDPADGVDDPIGGPRSAYERTATELDGLAAGITALLVPAGAEPSPLTPTSHQER